MNGKDFRALVRLSGRGDETQATPGETCERVDPKSLPWLLEQGYIERVEPAAAPQPDANVKAFPGPRRRQAGADGPEGVS